MEPYGTLQQFNEIYAKRYVLNAAGPTKIAKDGIPEIEVNTVMGSDDLTEVMAFDPSMHTLHMSKVTAVSATILDTQNQRVSHEWLEGATEWTLVTEESE